MIIDASQSRTLKPIAPERPAEDLRRLIDARLGSLLPSPESGSPRLAQAVRATCLGRGKRVRPILAMLSADHFGGRGSLATDFGCAVELIHTASIVLDDLPCMDNAATRRGQPSLHRRFGEDTAVLTAVALLNLAYGVVAADDAFPADIRLILTRLLSEAVGFDGLVTGQMRDLRDPDASRDETALTSLNHQKTSVLFVAAMVGGAVIAGGDEGARACARAFAERLGLVFQMRDDVQDATSTSEAMGKDQAQDKDHVTFVTLWGVERTRSAARETFDAALDVLGDRGSPLAIYVRDLFEDL